MTEIPVKRDPLRFRLYYRLMDACLFLLVPHFLILILHPDRPSKDEPLELIAFFYVIILSSVLGSLFLLLARFMRDEYAEGLWRRSLVVMGYLGAVVPPLFSIGSWIIYYIELGLSYPAAPLDGSVFARCSRLHRLVVQTGIFSAKRHHVDVDDIPAVLCRHLPVPALARQVTP